MALLDDPFSHRASALAAAELDETRFQNLVESWRMRVEGDSHGELADRYVKAYSARRAALQRARQRLAGSAENPSDPRFLSTEALGFREEAALVARPASAESASPPNVAPFTAPAAIAAPPRVEPSGVFAAPRLPPESAPPPITPLPSAPPPIFYSPSAPPTIAPITAAPAAVAAQPRFPRPSDRLAGTADISDVVARVALPFAKGSGSAPSSAAVPSAVPKAHRIDSGTASMAAFVEGRGFARATPPVPGAPGLPPPAHLAPPAAPPERPKRLIRFDPQTGHPLPAPIWVDIPEDPKK